MANSWRYVLPPDTKANITAALNAATIANAISTDSPAQSLSADATVVAHFTTAISQALLAVAALTGPAARCRVEITGYRDRNTSAPHPGAPASKINVSVVEFWT